VDIGAVNANGTLRGILDCWTPADDSTPACQVDGNDWSPDTLIKAGDPGSGVVANTINRIVAIRIAFVVRSDEPDFRNPALYRLGQKTIDDKDGTRGAQYLFNCPANTDVGCPNRVQIPAPAILQDGWRYRVYEAVVPLRNSLFAGTVPS